MERTQNLRAQPNGVSSVKIDEESPFQGLSLKESGLRQRDITVLAIERNGQTLPNPDGAAQILIGDRLVCFGKLENVRSTLVKNQINNEKEGNRHSSDF